MGPEVLHSRCVGSSRVHAFRSIGMNELQRCGAYGNSAASNPIETSSYTPTVSTSNLSTHSRRQFLQTAIGAAGVPWAARSWGQVAGANSDIRVAVIGFGGQGRGHIRSLSSLPGVRVVALCDVDQKILDGELKKLRDATKVDVKGYRDLREFGGSSEQRALPHRQSILSARPEQEPRGTRCGAQIRPRPGGVLRSHGRASRRQQGGPSHHASHTRDAAHDGSRN